MSNAEAALTWAGLAESSAREVVREYRGAISEEILPTMTTAPTLDAMSVDALYDYKANVLWRERDEIEARIHDVDEAICRAQGDREGETWHRLRARAHRTRDAKDEDRAHVAWVDMMAAMLLRQGKTPRPDEHCAGEIAAAMARIAP